MLYIVLSLNRRNCSNKPRFHSFWTNNAEMEFFCHQIWKVLVKLLKNFNYLIIIAWSLIRNMIKIFKCCGSRGKRHGNMWRVRDKSDTRVMKYFLLKTLELLHQGENLYGTDLKFIFHREKFDVQWSEFSM